MNTIELIILVIIKINIFIAGYEYGRDLRRENLKTVIFTITILVLFGIIIYIFSFIAEFISEWYKNSAIKQLHEVYYTDIWKNPSEIQIKHIDYILSLKKHTIRHFIMKIGAKEIRRRYNLKQ